jgi:hypothetical protein
VVNLQRLPIPLTREDLAPGVLQGLTTFRKIAEVTQRQGADAHRRMLDQVARLQRGDDVTTVPGHIHKAEINARLGL